MSKKLEKHLEELEEMTSTKEQSVSFNGTKGIGFLNDLVKSFKKKKLKEDDEMEENDEVEDHDDEDDEEEKGKSYTKKYKKSVANKANGGYYEDHEEDEEDFEDPAETGEDDVRDEDYIDYNHKAKKKIARGEIIENKGKRVAKESLKDAVKKHAHGFDERRFAKSFDDHEEVLDASPALRELTNAVRALGKSFNGTNGSIEELQKQNMILAKAVGALLEANMEMSGDIELIKKQPVNAPSTGFVVLNKQEGGKGRRLSKSDISDSLTDLVNEGLAEPLLLAKLGAVRGDAELNAFVNDLPSSVRAKL